MRFPPALVSIFTISGLLLLGFSESQARSTEHVTLPLVADGLVLSATDTSAPVSVPALQELIELALDSFGVPGLCVGVYHDGEVVLSQGFGVLEQGKPERVNAETLFAIASNTKAFVGTLAAMLSESEDDFSLTDRVSKYLPELDYADPAVTSLVNVADLMSHRIGLGTFKGDHLWWKRTLDANQVLASVDKLDLEYPFRAGYGYSNLGFVAAGEVLARITGAPWDDALHSRILSPLGMTRTTTHTHQLSSLGNFATGHVTRQDNAPIAAVAWDTPGAAGGIWSSSDDMLKWMACNLQEGVFQGDTVWSKRVANTAMRPHNTMGGRETFTSYGLGWFMRKVGAHTVVSHGGGYDGMYSQVQLVPSEGLGIVVLTNGMTGAASTLATHIRNLYLGTPQETWLNDALARGRRGDARWFAEQDSVDRLLTRMQRQAHTTPLQPGTYTDADYGTFSVVATDNELRLEFPSAPQLTASLESIGGNHYRLHWKEQHAWVDQGAAYVELKDGKETLRLFIPNDDIFYDSIAAHRD